MQQTLAGAALFFLSHKGLHELHTTHSEVVKDRLQSFLGGLKQIEDQGRGQVVLREFAMPERELQQIRLMWLQVGDQVLHTLFGK